MKKVLKIIIKHVGITVNTDRVTAVIFERCEC
jgi:hypothetical protein